jgi:Fe-S-cluster containining protein
VRNKRREVPAMPLPILQPQPSPSSAAAPQALPTVRALEALWQEVASRPLWAPPHLLRFLRLRWRMRLQLLDPARTTLVTPVGKINHCSDCSDSCCIGVHSTVLLGLRDIATLVDVGRTGLITRRKPAFSEAARAGRPGLRRHLASEAWRRFPVLAQNSFGACEALDVAGRCTLFPHWPMSCARFPMALHLEALEVFYSRRCRSFRIHPAAAKKAERIQLAAVASYNERIKDAVLLAYAPARLRDLGLMQHLSD